MKMKGVAGALLCLEYAASAAIVAASSTPRGVGPEFAQFYTDKQKFACISNPAIKLPVASVNDDYCDCPDGSDEPGTAACAHLSPLSPVNLANTVKNSINASLALPGFYCENRGHVPSYVPFTNVNDGICDYEWCCDGSEEFAAVGGAKCKNKCDEIGKEWRKNEEARLKSASNAAKKRQELVTEASRLRQQVQDRMQSLGAEIQGAELKVKQMEQELADLQRAEVGKVVKGGDGQPTGKLGVLVGLTKQRIQELRMALIHVRDQRDTTQERLEELEAIMTTFKDEYNPNFNDEGVKRAVRAWEDYIAGKGPASNAAADRDLDEMSKADEENGLDWREFQDDGTSDTDVLYAFENYLPPSLRLWLDQKLRDLRIMLIEGGILADNSRSSGNESKRVADARSRLEKARKDVEGHRTSLRDAEQDLEKDFGPDDVFRALQGQCVETDSGEYSYELCFLEKTTQKPKKGGANTNMGKYKGVETIVVDEDLPSDGKGLGSGERIALKYDGGQHCWNGPNRRTTVVLACAEKNEIWKIREEEKCVYRMEVGSPAACEPVGGAEKPVKGKDEL